MPGRGTPTNVGFLEEIALSQWKGRKIRGTVASGAGYADEALRALDGQEVPITDDKGNNIGKGILRYKDGKLVLEGEIRDPE